jgi:hypothetical protein
MRPHRDPGGGPAIRDYMFTRHRARGRLHRRPPHIRFGHRVTGAQLGLGSGALDGEVESGRRRAHVRLPLPVLLQRLLRLRAGPRPGVARAARVSPAASCIRSTGRATSTDAASGGGDRQRRDRRSRCCPAGDAGAHVTMLQRSPSYIIALPARDAIGRACSGCCRALAYRLIRWKNILLPTALFQFSRRRPRPLRRWLVQQAQRASGPSTSSTCSRATTPGTSACASRPTPTCSAPCAPGGVHRHRPDRALHAHGHPLASGEELPADIVVTATGLKLKMLGRRAHHRRRPPVRPGADASRTRA